MLNPIDRKPSKYRGFLHQWAQSSPSFFNVSSLLKSLLLLLSSDFSPFCEALRVHQNDNFGKLTAGNPRTPRTETQTQAIKFLTQTEVSRFFTVIDTPRERALFGTIYLYGLRVSEATLLTLKHLDFDRKTIYIKRLKDGMSSTKPLLETVARLLKEYLLVRHPTGEGLFTGREGNLGRHRIGQLFKRNAREAGIFGHSVHSLRHSIATHMADHGFSLELIRDHLGHRNIQTTLIYLHLSKQHLQKAYQELEKSPYIVKPGFMEEIRNVRS